MNIKEFREQGYLQEANRQFFHPLGLALEVSTDENGNEVLGGIWDYREDDDGIYYDLANSSNERIQRFLNNSFNIMVEKEKRAEARQKKLGNVIEPIKK
jgi:hypothetical protein